MEHIGGRVTTYGRKKTQIINVHNDFTPVRPTRPPSEDDSPSPTRPRTRPPLSSKLSQDVMASKLNMAKEETQTNEKDKKVKSQTIKVGRTKASILLRTATPTKVFRPPRAVRCRQATPASREKHAVDPFNKKREVMDCVEVVQRRPSPKSQEVDQLAKQLEKATIDDKAAVQKPVRVKQELPLAKKEKAKAVVPKTPADIKTLARSCSSSKIHPFTDFLSSPLLLDLIPTRADSPVIRKIGEASFSEVYGIARGTREVVLKVIPLLSEATFQLLEDEDEDDVEVPDCSEAADVRREVQITETMSELEGGGFIDFKGAFVVQGSYPDALLAQWDAYKSKHGTDSVRPGVFGAGQHYALIVLSDGGVDLESFVFDKDIPWLQASGIFWQVVDALARAEEANRFEHRDLHEGQILIQTNATVQGLIKDYMRPSSTGVNATMIDFGLSRLDSTQGKVTFTAFDEEVFEGVGEQWDVYRSIRNQGGGDWAGYHPVSNVMWINYILRYLVHSKSLIRPRAVPDTPRASPSPLRNSRASSVAQSRKADKVTDIDTTRSRNFKAWEVLKEMESVLSDSLGGRRPGGPFQSAADVWAHGQDKGWVSAV